MEGLNGTIITIDANDWAGMMQVSLDYYGTIKHWKKITSINGITNPDLIVQGQQLFMPTDP